MNSSVLLRSERMCKVIKPTIRKQYISKVNNYLEYWMHCIIDSMKQEDGVVHMLNSRTTRIPNKTFRNLKWAKNPSSPIKQESFRKGYIKAANEVSLTLAFLPHVDINIGKRLLTHLGYQLNLVIEASIRGQCPSLSPGSSGYGSDNSD